MKMPRAIQHIVHRFARVVGVLIACLFGSYSYVFVVNAPCASEHPQDS